MLYNVTTMATTWHTPATGDVSLLKRQMEAVCALPKSALFLNCLRCHDDPDKREDSRYLHRGAFQWGQAALREDPDTYQGKLFQGLWRLEMIRSEEPCFDAGADVWVEDSGDSRVLALCRRSGDRELVCLFNFSGQFVSAGVDRTGSYTELMYETHYSGIRSVELWPNGFAWLLRDRERC